MTTATSTSNPARLNLLFPLSGVIQSRTHTVHYHRKIKQCPVWIRVKDAHRGRASRLPMYGTTKISDEFELVAFYEDESINHKNQSIYRIYSSHIFYKIMSTSFRHDDLVYPNLTTCQVRLVGAAATSRPPVQLPRAIREDAKTLPFSNDASSSYDDFSLGKFSSVQFSSVELN